VDALRRQGRRARLGARLASRARADTPDHAEVQALDALVGHLERSRREAFVLTQVLGCSYAEAAAVCGVPVGTIRSRVARARADLIETLADDAAG
jgi:RNA polymerase sigma-70 factor (ECF subfamily)